MKAVFSYMFNVHHITLQAPASMCREGIRSARMRLYSIAECLDICSAAGEE